MAQRDQILSRILHLGGNQWYNAFWTLSMAFWDLLGSQKGFICSYIGLLEAPRRAPKVLKWVSDVYPVNIGQLNQYVVFGTKSGALKDLQRGEMCPLGIKQTPLAEVYMSPKNEYFCTPPKIGPAQECGSKGGPHGNISA